MTPLSTARIPFGSPGLAWLWGVAHSWIGSQDPLRDERDEALVLMAQKKGDQGRHAFDVLIDRFSQRTYRQLYRLLRDHGLADDVAQEVFVKAYLDLPKLREPATFPAWLRRIATRLAFNTRRDRKTQSTYEERAEDAKSHFQSAAMSPEAYTGAAEMVWKTLGELSYAYREILVLRYLEELSIDEIATQLDLGISATKMRLKRAREDFKDLAETSAQTGES